MVIMWNGKPAQGTGELPLKRNDIVPPTTPHQSEPQINIEVTGTPNGSSWAWKTSFLTAIAGLGLSSGEELDLQSKYLGKESSEQVRRIKADAGLLMAWGRFKEI